MIDPHQTKPTSSPALNNLMRRGPGDGMAGGDGGGQIRTSPKHFLGGAASRLDVSRSDGRLSHCKHTAGKNPHYVTSTADDSQHEFITERSGTSRTPASTAETRCTHRPAERATTGNSVVQKGFSYTTTNVRQPRTASNGFKYSRPHMVGTSLF